MDPRSLSLVLIALILTGSLSCTDRREDPSLPVHAYVALGLPDPEKKWEMADYTQAHYVLAKIKWDQPLQLPVKESEKSGAVFDRMVSLEYLSFLHDSTISLNEKAERISEFTRVYDYWMDVYTNPAIKRTYYNREIIDLQIFNLRITEAMLNLAHQINRSDDPADQGLKYGYEFIKGNYLACLKNDLKTQSFTSDFSERDLEKLTDSVYNSVIRNKEWMDSSAVSELKQSLRLVIDSSSSRYIHNKYTSLEKLLSERDLTHLKSQSLAK